MVPIHFFCFCQDPSVKGEYSNLRAKKLPRFYRLEIGKLPDLIDGIGINLDSFANFRQYPVFSGAGFLLPLFSFSFVLVELDPDFLAKIPKIPSPFLVRFFFASYFTSFDNELFSC